MSLKYVIPGIAIASIIGNAISEPPVQPSKAAIAQNTTPSTTTKNQAAKTNQPPSDLNQLIALWRQGKTIEDSLIARLVGSAEGTRTIDGGKTSIWDGHVDPGNGVWNKGTFSYQFGANLSPEESGKRQFNKILGHVKTAEAQAKQLGITLTAWEAANLIDLANQAPLCITEEGGYIPRLVEARKKGKEKGWNEYQIVLHARIWSYWDPQKGGWDAGGLRAYDDISKEESIRRDQDRRMNMMKQAIELAQKQGVPGAFKVNGGDSYQPVSYSLQGQQQFYRWLRTQSNRGRSTN